MFGKETEGGDMENQQTSILAQGCKFEGTVTVSGTFRVEGELQGTVATPENLIVGKTGVVNASVNVKNATIGGKLFGNIVAENKIELQSGSHVEGDIKTKRLVIDEGVFFEGNCSMGGPRKEDARPGGHGATPTTATERPAAGQPAEHK